MSTKTLSLIDLFVVYCIRIKPYLGRERKDSSTRVYQLVVVPFGSTQDLTLLVRRAWYPLHEFHNMTRVARG